MPSHMELHSSTHLNSLIFRLLEAEDDLLPLASGSHTLSMQDGCGVCQVNGQSKVESQDSLNDLMDGYAVRYQQTRFFFQRVLI